MQRLRRNLLIATAGFVLGGALKMARHSASDGAKTELSGGGKQVLSGLTWTHAPSDAEQDGGHPPHLPKCRVLRDINLKILVNVGLSAGEILELDSFLATVGPTELVSSLEAKLVSMGLDSAERDAAGWNLVASWLKASTSPEEMAETVRSISASNPNRYLLLYRGFASASPSGFLRSFGGDLKCFEFACAIACLTDPSMLREFLDAAPDGRQDIWDQIAGSAAVFPADSILRIRESFSEIPGVQLRMSISEGFTARIAAELTAKGAVGLEVARSNTLPTHFAAAMLAADFESGVLSWESLQTERVGSQSALEFMLAYAADSAVQSQLGPLLLNSISGLAGLSAEQQTKAGKYIGASVSPDSLAQQSLHEAPPNVRVAAASQLLARGIGSEHWRHLLDGINDAEPGIGLLLDDDPESAWQMQTMCGGSDEQRAGIVDQWMKTDPLRAIQTAGADTGLDTSSALRRAFKDWVETDSWGASIGLLEIKDKQTLRWATPLLADAIEQDDPEAAARWRALGQ